MKRLINFHKSKEICSNLLQTKYDINLVEHKLLDESKRLERRKLQMKVMLVCAMGMSTGMLISHMRDHGEEEDVFEAKPLGKYKSHLADFDLVLVGPQIRYQFDTIKATCNEAGKECELIDMLAYGRMDGKTVVEQAKKILEKKGGV